MAEPAAKLPVKNEPSQTAPSTHLEDWRPFETQRNQIDHLFRDFETGSCNRRSIATSIIFGDVTSTSP
jgi:hypothetical protein